VGRVIVIACAGLLLSGCVSATLTDSRLTALGRTAIPLARQSQTQQVVDVSDCRERIMDSLFHVGAYTLYNPLIASSAERALRSREERLATCLRGLGYGVPAPKPASR
jgi:hypothetical protein